HDMDVIMGISDWIVVLAQGQVIAEGRPEDIRSDERVIDAYLGTQHDEPGRGGEAARDAEEEAWWATSSAVPGRAWRVRRARRAPRRCRPHGRRGWRPRPAARCGRPASTCGSR